jgi:hypothetical protein
MPYSTPVPYVIGGKLVIEVELPENGEVSQSGRSENLVDPRIWTNYEDDNQRFEIKLTVCKPFRSSRRRDVQR